MKMSSTKMRGLLAGLICATTLAVSAGPLVTQVEAAPVTCPAAAGNARFVRFIFLSILARCPEASASTYWTNQLDGGMPRWTFTEAIDTSNENLIKDNAIPIYGGFLGRAPTAAEARAVAAHIVAQHEDGKIVAGILSSQEFYDIVPGTPTGTKAATPDRDQTWLTQAFMAILDRGPGPESRAYFTRRLHASGPTSTVATRLRVAAVLERSAENARGWTGAVFFAGLNRPPDANGFAFWLKWLTGRGQWQTFRMWTHILSSNEGYARAQTQPNPQPGSASRQAHRLGAFQR
jgi:hypothetical protein